jgi:hypothetical protein
MPPNDNLTAILYGIEDLRLENQKVPEISDDGEENRWKKRKAKDDD